MTSRSYGRLVSEPGCTEAVDEHTVCRGLASRSGATASRFAMWQMKYHRPWSPSALRR